MFNEKINEQLEELQEELSKLKTITDYIDTSKNNAAMLIEEVSKIHNNYDRYTKNIHNIFQQYIKDMSDDVSVRLKTEIKELQEVGYFISTSNQEKIIEVQNLLKKYKNIVEVSNHLVDKIESIDFSKKINYIDTKIQLLSDALVIMQTSIEQHQVTIQTQLIQRLGKQDEMMESLFSSLDKNINTKIQLLSGELVATQTSIEQYQTTIQTQLIQRLEKQDQVIKLIRNFLMLIGGLIIVLVVIIGFGV
ncbi:MAG: hypothetical protein U1E99_05235 [Agitococcus sp.]